MKIAAFFALGASVEMRSISKPLTPSFLAFATLLPIHGDNGIDIGLDYRDHAV